MADKQKTPSQVRSEAAEICEAWADERASCGDPEGADVFREAALEIRKIELAGEHVPTVARPFTVRSRP